MKNALFWVIGDNKKLGGMILDNLQGGNRRLPFIERSFPDGEHGSHFDPEALATIKGKTAIIIFTCQKVGKFNDYFSELGMLVSGLGLRARAGRIVLVCPFLPYRRQDHNDDRKGMSSLYEIPRLKIWLENLGQSGCDDLIAVQVHNSKNTGDFCRQSGINFFNIDTVNILVDALKRKNELVDGFVALDYGSMGLTIKARDLFDRRLPVFAFPKYRNPVTGKTFAITDPSQLRQYWGKYTNSNIIFLTPNDGREIRGKFLVIIDDEAATLGTVNLGYEFLKTSGVESVDFLFTHPVFSTSLWRERIKGFRDVICCNTLTLPWYCPGVHQIDISRLIAQEIKNHLLV